MSWGELGVMVHRMRQESRAAAEPEPAPRARRERSDLDRAVLRARMEQVARSVALSVPAYRTAHSMITKRSATLPLACYEGDYLAPSQPDWLEHPDPTRPLWNLVSATLDDAMWHDRAYWRITGVDGQARPVAFRRVPAKRVQEIDDPAGELLPTLYLDGKPATASLVRFSWEGLGGLSRHGGLILGLAAQLLETSGRYAATPMPSHVLRNKGVPLDDEQIDELLDDWEGVRGERATGFLNRDLDLQDVGWSSSELQLVEGREHSALEIARACSLPAMALDAAPPKGSNITYANIVDRRRELTEALRLWRAPIEQGLSLAARQGRIAWNDTSYLRDDPLVRMQTAEIGIRCGVLTRDEARRQEPMALDAHRSAA